nr:preprotein translocase subunit SecA [bacterium]
MGIITKIFGTANDRELKRLGQMLERVNALEPQVKALSDEQISARAQEIRDDIRAVVDEYEDDENMPAMVFAKEAEHLEEVFALTREAAVRRLGMRPFDVQIVGGIVLWEGKIAEMKTGEGKTLAATMPLTLHGMSGLGAHLVTVNDYLAKRDAEWMSPIYEMMGLNVGLCVHEVEPDERQVSYRADITYGTNNEFGFDYLRDN